LKNQTSNSHFYRTSDYAASYKVCLWFDTLTWRLSIFAWLPAAKPCFLLSASLSNSKAWILLFYSNPFFAFSSFTRSFFGLLFVLFGNFLHPFSSLTWSLSSASFNPWFSILISSSISLFAQFGILIFLLFLIAYDFASTRSSFLGSKNITLKSKIISLLFLYKRQPFY